MDSLRLYSLVVVVGGTVVMGAYALLRRKPKGPAELERERRSWLDGIGRITDGTVIDVQELPVSEPLGWPYEFRAVADKMGTLRPETRRRVMGENAARLYRL